MSKDFANLLHFVSNLWQSPKEQEFEEPPQKLWQSSQQLNLSIKADDHSSKAMEQCSEI